MGETLPNVIETGDTVAFSEVFTDYPASAYSMRFYLSLNGTAVTNVAGSGSGTTWSFVLSSTVTAALTAGEYTVAFRATKIADSTNYTARVKLVNVLASPYATATPTFAQTQVETIGEKLAALYASPQTSVSFNGQSFTQSNIAELRKELVYWQAQVIAEQRKANQLRGINDTGSIETRFSPTAYNHYPLGWPPNA